MWQLCGNAVEGCGRRPWCTWTAHGGVTGATPWAAPPAHEAELALTQASALRGARLCPVGLSRRRPQSYVANGGQVVAWRTRRSATRVCPTLADNCTRPMTSMEGSSMQEQPKQDIRFRGLLSWP